MSTPNHIEVIPKGSGRGKVYVIGDVHGEAGAFREVLARLSPDDTLIVVGDLIDRGEGDNAVPTSVEVLNTLIEHKQAPVGTKPKIHCVQGNHELLFLTVIRRLQDKELSSDDHQKKLNKDMLSVFIRNGGAWVFKCDPTNRYEVNRRAFFRAFCNGVKTPEVLAIVSQFIDDTLNSEDPFSQFLPDILKYKELIEELPFVIKVAGDPSRWVVHADLSFISDEEMDRRVRDNVAFTPKEIEKLTESRTGQLTSQGVRNSSSNLVIVGHNIIDEPGRKTTLPPALPVRADTNHINLDGGAFFTRGFLLLNLTDNKIEVVGKHITEAGHALLTYASDAIQTHLNSMTYEDEPSAKRRKV